MRRAMENEPEVRTQAMKDFEYYFLNTFKEPDDFVEFIVNNHRTLQQNFVRLSQSVLAKLATDFDEGRFDARNEASCRYAQLVRDEVMPTIGGFPTI